MKASHEPFYILAIDGGGMRAVFAAHILQCIEKSWGVNWPKKFHMFAGTSTGAILAAGLATSVSAKALLAFYTTHGPAVFHRKFGYWSRGRGLTASRYKSDALRAPLIECLPSKALGDIKVPLLIPCVDIGNGCVHVLKSGYDPEFKRDSDVLLVDAVMSSCSAPTYFDPYDGIKPYQLADGGLWANNPALAAFIEAQHRFGQDPDSIRILSIGTGTSKVLYPRASTHRLNRWITRRHGWGIVTRWKRKRLLDLILNLQSENTHNMLLKLLKDDRHNPKRILRLSFETDDALALDDVHLSDDLISRADQNFAYNSKKITDFLQLGEPAT